MVGLWRYWKGLLEPVTTVYQGSLFDNYPSKNEKSGESLTLGRMLKKVYSSDSEEQYHEQKLLMSPWLVRA